MNRLKGAELARLATEVGAFRSSSHIRYLSEALHTTRETGSPGDALALLVAMWDTAYAKSMAEKQCLNDVGVWLESRLLREPGVDAERIALELAWARRIARIAEARTEETRPGRPRGEQNREGHPLRTSPQDRAQVALRFGKRVSEILRRGQQTLERERNERGAPRPPDTGPLQPPAARAAPPRPTTLPALFTVEFVDFSDARDAFRKAMDRERKKKPFKERFLAIQPVEAPLRALAQGLVCSTALAGFRALFEQIGAQGGMPRTFFVRGVKEWEGRRVVIEILVDEPKTEGIS